MEIKVHKNLVGEYTIPDVFRYQLCHPGTGFAIYYDKAKYIITAKHLEAPPRKEFAWINGPRNKIEVKALRLPITYDAVAHQLLDFPPNELKEAEVFPHASDVKKWEQVIYFGFPRDEEFKMVQTNELQTREAEIYAIDDYGYYRKFHISPGPESGYSGSPLFRKKENGLVLIGIVAGKHMQTNPDGTTKDLQTGYAYSVDKVLKEIEASVDLEKEKRAARPKVRRNPGQP